MRSLSMKYLGVFILLFTLFQTGCGWQLRGSEGNSLESKEAFSHLSVFVNAPSQLSSMDKLLKKSLKSLGVDLDTQADITIELISERIEKRAMAYGSTGLPIQYQITMTTQYVMRTKTDTSLPEIKKVMSRRSLDFDPELVSAKDNEEQELHTEMREEIGRTILRNLRKLSTSLTPTHAPTIP